MAKPKGADKVLRRLRALNSPAAEKRVGGAMLVAADMLAVEAAHLITAGSVSGKNHVVSLPHEPPNSDSHELDRSIRSEKAGKLAARAVADAAHAAPLEFGKSKMVERPFMRPAAATVRPKAQALVAAALRDEFRKVRK